MKFSTIMAVAAITLTFVAGGCKYDDVNGAGANGANGGESGNISDITGAEDQESGDDISAVAGVQRFEDMYTKCTDVSFEPVFFGFDSTVVPQEELSKVDAVAKHLKDNSDRVVVIEGNCDERGSAEYNLSLGENRAIIVRNYLVQSEIAADRIQTRSYGEEKPAVDGHDESAWAKNRRAEFAIFKK